MTVARIGVLLAFLILTGCAGDQGKGSGASATGGSGSCESTCNTGYDTCTGRFAGISGDTGFGRSLDDTSGRLGPNNVCPDELKSCLRRCLH